MLDETSTFKKTLFFYDISSKPFDIMKTSGTNYNTKYFLKKAFPSIDSFRVNGLKIIQIYEFTDEFLFGSVGKLEDNSKLFFKRTRDITDLKSNPLKLENPNLKIEDFTFFYIGNNFTNIVVLKNDDAPRINNCLCKYVQSKCPELEHIRIFEQKIDNIKDELKKFREFLNISFAFKAKKYKNSIPLIKELSYLSENDIERVNINLDIHKQIADKKFLNEISENDYSHLLTYKIKGLTEDSTLEQSIDLIKQVLTKKVVIDLQSDWIVNESKIKDILSKELFNSIKRNTK